MNQNSVKTIGINDEARKDSHLVYVNQADGLKGCLLYTSPSPRDAHESRMPSSA